MDKLIRLPVLMRTPPSILHSHSSHSLLGKFQVSSLPVKSFNFSLGLSTTSSALDSLSCLEASVTLCILVPICKHPSFVFVIVVDVHQCYEYPSQCWWFRDRCWSYPWDLRRFALDRSRFSHVGLPNRESEGSFH